ncbi:unnamed protein product [Staurois parvus]|uniref:Uncharacterized protein n=1 Tax=Staurois parvus TaxID=386267 RepID=A0ABN9GP46_9NEOB|nr:unnamed protein product [Staurois parvus]
MSRELSSLPGGSARRNITSLSTEGPSSDPGSEGTGYTSAVKEQVLLTEWTQHWWWDSPAVWAAVPGLTSGCSQQPEAHSCSQPTPGADCRRCI